MLAPLLALNDERRALGAARVYTKLIEGRTIDRMEAIQIALDGERAASLAKRIILEKDGLGNWHLCSKQLRLAPEVNFIQSMMK